MEAGYPLVGPERACSNSKVAPLENNSSFLLATAAPTAAVGVALLYQVGLDDRLDQRTLGFQFGLVAISEGRIAGFLSYTLEREALVLVMLNILPAYQGRGEARTLFKVAVRETRERGLSPLSVATSDHDPLALYLYQRWDAYLEGRLRTMPW